MHRRVGNVAAHAAAQTAGNAATGSAAAVAGGNGNFPAPAIAAAATAGEVEECVACDEEEQDACDEEEQDVEVDNEDTLRYDASIVGRRATALWTPPPAEDEEEGDGEEGYYACTVVAFNPRIGQLRLGARAAADRGRFLLHFDDGQRERVELPDPSVRIMTAKVTSCSCKDSPAETPGCFRGSGGSKKLPRPWEATPQ